MRTRKEIIESVVSKYRNCPYEPPQTARRGKPHTTVDFSGIPETQINLRDKFYMRCALELAAAALEDGEVPVGALIVCGGEIVSADFNGREKEKNALYHAEVAAIDKACRTLGGWRLPGCELFVTLEPCIMCSGAIISARVPRVVFGAGDAKAGFFGGVADVREFGLNHKLTLARGVLEDECSQLMTRFFERKRSGTDACTPDGDACATEKQL